MANLTTGIFVLDLFLAIIGFVLFLGALLYGIIWLIAMSTSGRTIDRRPRPRYSRLHGFNDESSYSHGRAHAILNERGEVDRPIEADFGEPLE